jgi:hypothetical protein
MSAPALLAAMSNFTRGDMSPTPTPFQSITIFDTNGDSILSVLPSKRTRTESPLTDLEEDIVTKEPGPSSTPKKRLRTASPRKAKSIRQSLKTPHPAPAEWRETYDAIKQMRSRILAPVDTMGCDQARLKEQDPRVRGTRFSQSRLSAHHTRGGRRSDTRRSCRLCCRRKRKTR